MTSRVEVSDDGDRYTVATTHVIERTGEQCPRCGEDLWTRDGVGKYTLAFIMPDGGPVLRPHYAMLPDGCY